MILQSHALTFWQSILNISCGIEGVWTVLGEDKFDWDIMYWSHTLRLLYVPYYSGPQD